MNFHNTVNVQGDLLSECIRKCKSQEERILAFFQLCPRSEFTPFDVQKCLSLNGAPITSVRRALTNLTKLGFLEKTGRLKVEKLGMPNNKWRLRR